MYDFAYRVAIDTYEQMNGKIKVPYLVYQSLDTPTKPGLLCRILRAIRESRSHRPSGIATQQPGVSSYGAR